MHLQYVIYYFKLLLYLTWYVYYYNCIKYKYIFLRPRCFHTYLNDFAKSYERRFFGISYFDKRILLRSLEYGTISRDLNFQDVLKTYNLTLQEWRITLALGF